MSDLHTPETLRGGRGGRRIEIHYSGTKMIIVSSKLLTIYTV